MRRLLPVILPLALLAHAALASAAPAPGDVDRGFGQGGYAAGDTIFDYGSTSVAGGPGGEIFVLEPNGTECEQVKCVVQLRLAHYARNGARDPLFGADSFFTAEQISYQRSALAVGSDGRPVVAATDGDRVVVVRFGRDGRPDPSFGLGGRAAQPNPLLEPRGTPPVVAVQDDGRVLLAYEAREGAGIIPTSGDAGGEGRLVLARFLADGGLDRSFGDAGVLVVGAEETRPAGIAFRAGGSFELALSRCCRGEGGSAPVVGLDRFLIGGGFDASLRSEGQLLLPRPTDTYAEAIAPGPGGRTYLVVNEERRGAVAVRLLPSGVLDPAFGKGGEVQLGRELGFGASSGVRGIATDDSGRLVGVAGAGAGAFAFRLLKNGRPDRTFGAGVAVPIRAAGVNVASSGFVLQPGGRPVVLVEAGPPTARGFFLARLVGGNSKVRCLGKKATIVGTAAPEKIVGSRGRDVIAAMGGADRVQGLGGEDRICGGKGRDQLFGGAGHDRVRQ
jgi:RTX calcium-binding nonapeptide repeat (4 copies)/Domain of unknown function (DUF5122) beta-propeller